ncbi:MAG: pyridoxal phosphate-dependent aminotransferase [Alphaproteobacteria bacterium GM202ARS2]|nr:pyridoxal phosphate-dependent aminotransferase [Alphaproteobacteria bacterium GM202ARS2]
MTIIAQRMGRIQPSPTLAVTKKAADMRARGENVISLGAGEPDFDTPDFVKASGISAIEQGLTKYTAVGGTPTIKEAVRHKFQRDNGLRFKDEEVIVGTGGKQVLFNVLLATVDAGDEVIIPAPYWVSYPDMVRLAEGTPIIVSCGQEHGFKLTPESLASAITPKTKWLIINSPGNPSGAVYSADELRALAGVLDKHPHVHVLSDDMYEHILYDGVQFATLASVAPDLATRVVTVNGVSKAYAMTGWRIGFAGGDAVIIAAMAKIQSQSTSNPCSISQAAAATALRGDQSFLQERNQTFKERRDLVVARLNGVEGLSCPVPQGAFYVFVNCQGVLGRASPSGGTLNDDVALADYLLSQEKVALVAGTAFGSRGYFRISYATSTEALTEACQRIERGCAALR